MKIVIVLFGVSWSRKASIGHKGIVIAGVRIGFGHER
jgi:hypothetical protein